MSKRKLSHIQLAAREADLGLFIDECLCKLGLAFGHTDEDSKRKDTLYEVFAMLDRRTEGDVQTVSPLILTQVCYYIYVIYI